VRKPASLGLFALLLLSMLTMMVAAAPPLPSPWPPEVEWLPTPREAVWPDMRKIAVYGGHHDLSPGEPFFLRYGWIALPTRVAYDAEDSHVVEPFECLQNRDSNARTRFSITLDGDPLYPNMFRYTVKWWRFYNDPELYLNPPLEFPLAEWSIAPKAMGDEYWVEYSDGLEQGDYEVVLIGYPAGYQRLPDGWQPFEFHTYLHVWPGS
jgi:hypothetical protein